MTTVTNIPAWDTLRQLPRWVFWCYEEVKDTKGNSKKTKIPYNVRTGYKASSTDSKTWATYEAAVKCYRSSTNANGKKYDGIGFVFCGDITGIDLDHCVNPDGSIDAWAQEILDSIRSYAEYSPSKTGIHVYVFGLLPEMLKNNKTIRPGVKVYIKDIPSLAPKNAQPDAAIEMYCEGRFFTFTKKQVAGTAITIEQRQEELLTLHQLITKKPQKKDKPALPSTPLDIADSDLLSLASQAKNGAKFAALWRGDIGGYGSQSEADQALCNMLAFWTGCDISRMGSLFKQSGLHRDKWDNHSTYATDTLNNAVSACTETYTPRRQTKSTLVLEKEFEPLHVTPIVSSNGNGNGSNGHHKKTQPEELPEIIIGAQLRETSSEALQALQLTEEKKPTLFIQAGEIKRVGRDEKHMPFIGEVGENELRGHLTRSANYFRLKEKNGEFAKIAVSPPKDVVQDILSLKPEQWSFPPIEAIVQMPVLRADGTVVGTPGYDKQTSLYYMPQSLLDIPAIPAKPTKEQVATAAHYVQGFFQDFPYESQADHANAIGLALTTICRQMFRHVPIALIDATKQGVGKGLMTDAITEIATGAAACSLSQVASDEEWDKRITALLLNGATMIVIDNVEGVLRSPILAKILTSETHNGRVLGTSKMANVPQRAIWIANGNNIQLGGDMPRRSFRIRMVTQVSNPWEREDFKYPDLQQAVRENRGKIIAALLTIACGWFGAGKPAPAKKLKKLGTFTEWVNTIGGMLSYAGIDGFLENLEDLHKEADIDGNAWANFYEMWLVKLGAKAYKTSEIIEALNQHSELADTLPEPLGTLFLKEDKSLSRKLGRHLSKKNGTPFGSNNLRIVQDMDSHSKVATFKVAGYSPLSQEDQAQNAGYAGYCGYGLTSTRCANQTDEKQIVQTSISHIEDDTNETRNTPHTPQGEHNPPENATNTPQSVDAMIARLRAHYAVTGNVIYNGNYMLKADYFSMLDAWLASAERDAAIAYLTTKTEGL